MLVTLRLEDLRPLLRQAVVAGCAALETYVVDKAMYFIGSALGTHFDQLDRERNPHHVFAPIEHTSRCSFNGDKLALPFAVTISLVPA